MKRRRRVSSCMTIRMRTLSAYVAKKSTSSRFLLLLSLILSAKSFSTWFSGSNAVTADFIAHFGCHIHVVFLASLEREGNPKCTRRWTNDPSGDTTKHILSMDKVGGKQVVNKEHTLTWFFHSWSRPISTTRARRASKMAAEERMDAIRVANVCSNLVLLASQAPDSGTTR